MVDMDHAVLGEERWTVADANGQPVGAQSVAGSRAPSKAISHLSRMSIKELDKQTQIKAARDASKEDITSY